MTLTRSRLIEMNNPRMTNFTKKRDTYELANAEAMLGQACKKLGYKGIWMRKEDPGV